MVEARDRLRAAARPQLSELLDRLCSEVEQLEAQHRAAKAQSRSLAEENASLRSRLKACDQEGPAADDWRPASTVSNKPKEFAADEGPLLLKPGRPDVSGVEEVSVLSLPGRLLSPRGLSPPLSVTSTPRLPQAQTMFYSPRAVALSQGPEVVTGPALPLPAQEPAVLRPTFAELPDVTDKQVEGDSVSDHGKRERRAAQQNIKLSQRIFVGAIGQFSRRTMTFDRVNTGPLQKEFTLRGLATSSYFDGFFNVLILCNAVFMALEAQYRGIDAGVTVNHPKYNRMATETWPAAGVVFDVMGWVFGIIFLLEVLIKIAGMRIEFVKSIWNLFDMIVVVLWVLEKAVSTHFVDATLVRMGRCVRLVRLARMVRTIAYFDSLQVLLGSIQASVSALLWSSCLLLLIQMMVGLLLHNLLQETMADLNMPEPIRRQVFNYWGTFSRSMISMFELTLANWPTICWLLVDNVSEWYGVFIVIYKLVIGFAVLAIITGVFLHETFKVASEDEELMLFQKQRAQKNHIKKMERLFREADTSCDGKIDRAEFRHVLSIKKVKTWLSAMELEVSDPDLLFDFLDDGDGEITVAELIDGVARLKGSARNIDVIAVMHNISKLYELLSDVKQRVEGISHSRYAAAGGLRDHGRDTVGDSWMGLRAKRSRRA